MTIERILSKVQRRTVIAVYADRQRLLQELNECDEALIDLAKTYRSALGLPEGEYQFRGDGNEIRIVRVERPTEAVPQDDEGTEGEKLVDGVVEADEEDASAEEETGD